MQKTIKILGALVVLLAALYGGLYAAYNVPDRSVDELKARWGQPPSQFVAIGDLTIHLRDEGPRDDPAPIVLLHGTSSSLHTWDGWAAALAPQHRVVRYDMPGFGLTGPSPQARYRIEDYVQTLIAVLDQLGIRRCTLAGNSLGGYVAWSAAVLHPERIDRLVLIDAAGYPYQSASVPIGFRIARIPLLGALTQTLLPRSIIESSVRNVYGDPNKVTPELIDRYFDLTTRAGNRAALLERFRQSQPGHLVERIGEIKAPTLIEWGAKDRLIPPEFGDRFHREIAGSALIRFEALGHVPQEEDPAATVAALLRFLPPAH